MGDFRNSLNLNEWTHIAFSVVGKDFFGYLNGILNINGTGKSIQDYRHFFKSSFFWYMYFIQFLKGLSYKNVHRTFCYIGKSTVPGDSLLNAVIDDLKIFRRGSNHEEIVYEMNRRSWTYLLLNICKLIAIVLILNCLFIDKH